MRHDRLGRPRRLSRVLLPVLITVLLGAGLAIWTNSAGPTTPNAAAPAVRLEPLSTPPATTTTTATTTTVGTTTRPPTISTTAAVARVAPAVVPAGSHLFTFVNQTRQTIWLAGWQQTPTPTLAASGWVLPVGGQVGIVVPPKWNGRFWGRTGCAFTSAGTGHCATGDCAGVFQCKGYGAIPATLAEYNLNSWRDLDFYDVSMVDGSNLPMYINITKGGTADKISPTGCVAAGCTTAVACPAALVVDGGAGCESPCAKLGGDQFCCRGAWSARSACDPTRWQPQDYAAVFKRAEPFAYSYVDDDATSTFTCTGDCDYRITFGLTP